jgi:dTMP kinase
LTSGTSNGGKFITLEGGEGTGKSTQAPLLAGHLRRAGIDALVTREPGGAPGAEEIRKLLVEGAPGRWDPISEALLHFAARREHLERTVLPAIAAGRWVISDRFADSTMAYQGYGLGVGRQAVEALYRIVVGTFAPDLTIILDLSPELGLERSRGGETGEDRYERMDEAFHRRLREGYLDIARRQPERCAVIAADCTIEEVEAKILATVGERLGVNFR